LQTLSSADLVGQHPREDILCAAWRNRNNDPDWARYLRPGTAPDQREGHRKDEDACGEISTVRDFHVFPRGAPTNEQNLHEPCPDRKGARISAPGPTLKFRHARDAIGGNADMVRDGRLLHRRERAAGASHCSGWIGRWR